MAPRKIGILTASSLCLGLVAAAAPGCGTRTVAGDGATAPAGGPQREQIQAGDDGAEAAPAAQRQRALHLAIELEDLMNVRDPSAAQTRVSLVATDETGSAKRRVLGVFQGICTEAEVGAAEPGLPRPALVGADCDGDARDSRIRVVEDSDSIVALRAWIGDSEEAAEFPAFDEIDRLDLRPGAQVITGDPPR